MTPTSGERTGEFGYWLTHYLARTPRYRDYIVYYDHGNKQSEPNVAVIHGFCGAEVNNTTRLAEVDVMVATPDGELVLLVEVEESAVSPKKLLGPLVAILMCNGFAVQTHAGHCYFTITPDTRLIVTGVASPRGDKLRQITEVIEPRLGMLEGLSDGIAPSNVSLVLERNITASLEVLGERVQQLFPKV